MVSVNLVKPYHPNPYLLARTLFIRELYWQGLAAKEKGGSFMPPYRDYLSLFPYYPISIHHGIGLLLIKPIDLPAIADKFSIFLWQPVLCPFSVFRELGAPQ